MYLLPSKQDQKNDASPTLVPSCQIRMLHVIRIYHHQMGLLDKDRNYIQTFNDINGNYLHRMLMIITL